MTTGAEAWLVDERWFKAYPLTDETAIGRGVECTIILRDPAVSRQHAGVMKTPGGYVVRAYGSAGTSVNGERVETERVLQEGDVIEIAFTTLRFTLLAPTGELFIVSRDKPTFVDRAEGATRATIQAARPSGIRWWKWYQTLALAAVVLLILLALVFAYRAP